MSPLGGAVTMDVDGKGHIWASAPDGVVMFDPVSEKFTDFKSKTPYQNTKGTNMTYGAAGDRDGNGWWAQMAFDTIGKADVATHSTSEVVLPSLKDELARVPAPAKAFYDSFNELTVNNPLPWSEGPRRMGTDKNADILWVGNSWGCSLARIDTKTLQTTIVPFPDPSYQPYHIAVDKDHNGGPTCGRRTASPATTRPPRNGRSSIRRFAGPKSATSRCLSCPARTPRSPCRSTVTARWAR